MASLLVLIIRVYKALVSPLLPFNHCRFYPTCSQYAEEALQKYGVLKGLRLAVLRILKCHPFHDAGGYDPIP